MGLGRRSLKRGGTLFVLGLFLVSPLLVWLGEASAATPRCFGKRATIVGTRAANRLVGTDNNDVIVGGGGGDKIYGLGGNDTICGGSGNDVIYGGMGRDLIAGGSGNNDRCFSGRGNDFPTTGCEGGADPSNAAPIADDDGPFSVDEDSGPLIETAPGVLAGDTDTDGPLPLTATLETGPSDAATFTLNADGSFDYTPDPDFCGPDPFTYRAVDGMGAQSAVATVGIGVTCINDAPSFTKGPDQTVDEDDGAQIVAGWATAINAGPPNESAQALTFNVTNNTNPGLFSAGPLVGSSGTLTYTPADGTSGSADITIELMDDGGTAGGGDDTSPTQTFTITVNAVDDPPVVTTTSGNLAYTEDDPPTVIDPGVTVTDVDDGDLEGASVQITGNCADPEDVLALTTPPIGTTVVYTASTCTLTVSGTAPTADYETALRTVTYENTSDDPSELARTVTFTASDSSSSDSDTRGIVVTGVNDAPDITAPANVATVLDTPVVIGGVSLTDPDSGTDDVRLDLVAANGILDVNTGVSGGVTAGDVTGDGTDTVSILAPVGAIDTTLNDPAGLTYTNDSGFGGTSDTVDLDVDDLGNNGTGGPLTDSATVTIQFNTPPTADDQTVTTDEDTPVAITLTGADADLDPITFIVTSLPATGQLRDGPLVTDPLITTTPHTLASDQVTYIPPPDANGTALESFDFKTNDGVNDSAEATVTLDVTAVNDPPAVTAGSGSASFTEGGGATAVAPDLTVADVDDTDLESATVAITANLVTGDALQFTNQSGISGVYNSGTGVLTLTGSATLAEWQTALRSVTFSNTGDDPTAATRTVSFTVNDGDVPSNTDGRDVAVTPVNDPPVVNLDVTGPVSYTENAGFQNLTGSLATVTDPDNATLDSLVVTVTSGFDAIFDDVRINPIVVGFDVSQTSGTFTITKTGGGGTPTDFTSALRAVQFENTDDDPDDREDGTPDPALLDRTFSFVADDGTDTSTAQTRGLTITPVNDAPSTPTTAPTTSSVRNTTLVSGTNSVTDPKVTRIVDLIADSTDPDGPDSNIAVVPVTSAATTQSGRITLNAAGDLVYEPPASVALASDTYGYSLTDGTTASSPITFTVNLAGEVWYVADGAGGTQDGTSARPFDTLAEAVAVGTTSDVIHIRRAPGDGTLTAGITLLSGQKLIGEGAALTSTDVGAPAGDTLFAAGTKPVLTASGADVVTVAANTQVAGVTINPDGAGGGIFGNNTAGITLRTMDVNDTGTAATQPGIELTGTGNGLTLSGTVDVTMQSNRAVSVAGAVLSGTFTNVTTTASTNGGASLSSTTGSLTFQNLVLTTTSSSPAALQLTNVTNVDVDGTNFNATITAGGGPAVDVSQMDAASSLVFDSVSSSGSASDGIRLDNAAGTFTASAGTLQNAAGQDVDISGDNVNDTVNFTYDGTISDTSGTVVNVSGQSGGLKDFNGAIGTAGTPAGAISLSSNTGATIRFDGGMVLSTGATNAFSATGGGTVSVIDPNAVGTAPDNTLVTTTGTALTVTSTTIGSDDLNFKSISSNGATNGILLSNTGSESLAVAGTGTAGSGGTVANSTGAGVSLTSTGPISLSRMNIQNGADDGIRGSSVNGLTLTGVSVAGNGNAVGEDGIEITQLTGSGGITDSVVTGSADDNVNIANTSGTLTDFDVTDSSFTSNSIVTGNDGFLLENNGSGSMTVSITGSTFTDNKGDHFQFATQASASGTSSVTFSGNTLTTTAANDDNVIGGGITVSPSGSADTSFVIDGNNIQQAFDEAINMNLGTAATSAASMIGTISNNIVGTAAEVDSGSESGTGINVTSNGAGLTTVAVTGNQVRQYANPYGILLTNKEGSSNLNATVTGNTVANPGTFAINGIRIDSGAASGDTGTLCAAVTGNTAAGSGPSTDTDIRLRQRFGTTIRLPGYAGANNDTTAVNSFVAGNNAGTDVSSVENVAGGGGGFVGGAACPTP